MERSEHQVPEGLKVEHAVNRECTEICWTERDLEGPAQREWQGERLSV